MKDKMIEALSDISRTNQLKISPTEDVAEKLFQYLYKMGKGIEFFSAKNLDLSEYDNSSLDFFQKRHRVIKKKIKAILTSSNQDCKYRDIQYFLSSSGGENIVFFISPNKNHSGWKGLFNNNRERIFNLVFKFYILSQGLSIETINGFEELLLLHSMNLTKSKDALWVWGQNLFINYNYHNVLTLNLSRKSRIFLPKKDQYSTTDGDDLGEVVVYKDKKVKQGKKGKKEEESKNYYFERNLDARRKNDIYFIQFPTDSKDYDKFKKTQLYHYQNLMTKIEGFLTECGIQFDYLDFWANRYLENNFITNIEPVESLEIINNTGVNLSEDDQQFLTIFLKHQGISLLTFYNFGKTISTYEQVEVEGEDEPCWRITEVISWSNIELDQEKNYLVFNKLLEEEAGSMAYQRDDGFWYPSKKIDDRDKVDFYSQLKKRFDYLKTGVFFSFQGINISQFRAVGGVKSAWSVITYNKIDLDTLRADTQTFTNGELLDIESSICRYLTKQEDSEQWKNFWHKYNNKTTKKIKISPEFQKVLIEMGIKNWMRQSLVNHSVGLSITPQLFPEKKFFTIYVRSPKDNEAKAVAIEFLYKEGCIFIENVIHDIEDIKRRFRFLRTRKNSEDLINDQQYFVDELEQLYISCYTSDFYTPTLIGRNGILEDMENGELKINRQIGSKLLPLVSYYNSDIKPINRIQNMICFDLRNETFIQYYVPPAKNIDMIIKTGFRVYHLIGRRYNGEEILTSELIEHPITALHFSTLTQNVLRISDNSQSSLLQKVAKILIEN